MKTPPLADRIFFNYLKSNFFRTVYADGVYGGVTPNGMIHCAFYNTRSAFPKQTSVTMPEPGLNAGPEQIEDALPGMVREIEVDVMMDVSFALSFQSWLDQKIEFLKVQSGMTESDWNAFKGQIQGRRDVPE